MQTNKYSDWSYDYFSNKLDDCCITRIHTSIVSALGWLLTFALVNANGCPHCLATSQTNPLAGTLIPIVDDSGLRLGLRATVLWNTTVTGPGSSSRSSTSSNVTRPQLDWKNNKAAANSHNARITQPFHATALQWITQHTTHINTGGGLAQLVATLVRSTKLLYAGPG